MSIQFLQQLALDEATGILYDAVSERALFNGLTNAQAAAAQAMVSGTRIADAVSRSITINDNGAFLAPTAALTYTIPSGLSPMPSFTVDCPATGAISIARSGSATINGAATTITRARASNPVGFVVLAHEADAYGVSGT